MADVVARCTRGESVLFYTWTPNWTVGTLVPGKDVVWIEVPFPSLPDGEKIPDNQSTIKGVPGCVNDPCAMGFPPNDIRVVANKNFLANHPDIRRLLELVEIPLEDISAQNARMLEGEDDDEDIRRHALEWISGNRKKIDRWLEAARVLQPIKEQTALARGKEAQLPKAKLLRVVTKRFEPFVIYQDREYIGFSIECNDHGNRPGATWHNRRPPGSFR
jgi:hypothetical protein